MQCIWPTPASFRVNVWACCGHGTMTCPLPWGAAATTAPEACNGRSRWRPRYPPASGSGRRPAASLRTSAPGDLGPEVVREGQRGEVIAVSGGEVARDRGVAVPDRQPRHILAALESLAQPSAVPVVVPRQLQAKVGSGQQLLEVVPGGEEAPRCWRICSSSGMRPGSVRTASRPGTGS